MADKMNEDSLKALVDSEMRQAVGYFGGKLAESRRKAEYYYLGLPKGDLSPPDIEGRSSVVDTTVRNQIEWMVPSLMKTFCSGENVVEFTASKEGDEEKAKLATSYINHIFYKQNEGYKVLQTAIRDALLQKAGIIKVWFDDRVEETREEYKGLCDIELAQLMQDDEIEPIEQKSYPDEEDAKQRSEALQQLGQQLTQASQAAQMGDPQAEQAVQQIQQQIQGIQSQPQKLLYDVAFKRSKEDGRVRIENVPPEEFMISRKAKSIQDTPFVAHRVMRTASDLVAMGYKNVDQISSDENGAWLSMERIERIGWDDELTPYVNLADSNVDPSQRVIWVTEAYIKTDYDGDGIAEWRKVVKAGNEILENEECDGPPFAVLVPIILPHRFFGLSVADLAIEPQRVQTYLLRAMLDNLFLQVNGRYYAVEGQVNLDDLLTSRPGGVVRMKQPGMAGRLDQASGDGASAMNMLNWMQDFTENATGWTRRSQGTGPGGVQQQTATGMNIITNRDDMRLDLIARNFAEGGITDLFKLILKLVTQHQDKDDVISISGEWTPIAPREWKNQFELNINVGLGTNNKDQQAQHLMGMMQIQEKAIQIGVATPENIYNSAVEYAKAMGHKDGDKFFSNPAKMPPAPPKPDPEMMKYQAQSAIEDKKLQADVQKHHAEQQARQMELQLEAERNKQQADSAYLLAQHKAELDMQERQHDAELKAQLHAQELEFNRWKTQLEAETKVLVAQIGAEAKEAPESADMAQDASVDNDTQGALAMALQGFQAALGEMQRPKTIVRGPDGKAQGIM